MLNPFTRGDNSPFTINLQVQQHDHEKSHWVGTTLKYGAHISTCIPFEHCISTTQWEFETQKLCATRRFLGIRFSSIFHPLPQ